MNEPQSDRSSYVAVHLVAVWVLFLFSQSIFFVPLYVAFPHVVPLLPSIDSGASVIGVAVAGLALLILLLYVALHVFLRLWFGYLRRLPKSHIIEVERKLPSVLNVAAFEPQYSRVRQRVLGEQPDA